ncbi:uncharacterized protein LOC143250312 isoform X1 [Tachypleus tridentatus]|uniref:uncharacterized protein LOC143250312 isoform X1 n=1 Tax=Tachypleus tridentatus TaxID=6853 RepID=UPI003FD2BC61
MMYLIAVAVGILSTTHAVWLKEIVRENFLPTIPDGPPYLEQVTCKNNPCKNKGFCRDTPENALQTRRFYECLCQRNTCGLHCDIGTFELHASIQLRCSPDEGIIDTWDADSYLVTGCRNLCNKYADCKGINIKQYQDGSGYCSILKYDLNDETCVMDPMSEVGTEYWFERRTENC